MIAFDSLLMSNNSRISGFETTRVLELFGFLSFLFFISACTTEPRGLPPTEGIANFDRVNEHLYRGAQPGSFGMTTLRRHGVKTIVNLRMTNDVWADEATEARHYGVAYTNVPMIGIARPTDEQVMKVLSIIETSVASSVHSLPARV
jgi:hypothetical protein